MWGGAGVAPSLVLLCSTVRPRQRSFPVSTQTAVNLLGACCLLVPPCCRWVWSAGGRPLNTSRPVLVRLTSSTGAVREARLPDLQPEQDLGVQFS